MRNLFFIASFLIVQGIWANISLPAIFSDHMVLQQNANVKFWGWAAPDEEVVIQPSWTSEVYKVKANVQAQWEMDIQTPKAGEGHSIKILGYNSIEIKDVLIGEVWLCSGQSNMEMSPAWGIKNNDEVAKANVPNLRFFRVTKTTSIYPQNNLPGTWEVCTPETMKNNSAVGYFFAQQLQRELPDTPVGLVVSAWGGTPIEAWTPEATIFESPVLNAAAQKLEAVPYGPIEPGRIFNAMIQPLVGYQLTGALWYQGEANVGVDTYDVSLEAMIQSWRKLWKAEFPFYYVQIAPYNYGEDIYSAVKIRNAQRQVLDRVANTGMVVIDDVSTVDDIHPKDKKSVGIRLANLALNKRYNVIDEVAEGPLFESVDFDGKRAVLTFKNNDGLYLSSSESLFEIAGEDKVFYEANAKLVKGYLELKAKEVKAPKYVRFAWNNSYQSNLFNGAHLPASCFTTE
ncbi:sialate O-acetylesterase [Mangrovimonas sp. TPBH4]|uniref:sialate O-acetylesterase n=1 Tax=Mangrovimonas sp. TPBH4 TaxID=1645914 RepID=UPI0006B45420|nr:sialate O-acetylesterase [Mangrovimonas sp. TPBH4]